LKGIIAHGRIASAEGVKLEGLIANGGILAAVAKGGMA